MLLTVVVIVVVIVAVVVPPVRPGADGGQRIETAQDGGDEQDLAHGVLRSVIGEQAANVL